MANNSSSQNQEKNKENVVPPSILTFEDIDHKLGLTNTESPPKKRIFQVPIKLRKFSEDRYIPRVVSIGPMHQGKSELLAMDELKWGYVKSFFYRNERPKTTLEEAWKKILVIEDEARKYYACDLKVCKYELARILIIDGCFILEILLRKSGHLKWNFNDKSTINIKEDPILNNDLMIQMLQQDLALLENQIPFIVLKTLFHCIDSNIPPLHIPYLTHVFFGYVSNYKREGQVNVHMEEEASESNNLHLLEIMHKYYLPESQNMDVSVSGDHEKMWKFEHCATKLYEGGLKFEKASSDRLLEIEFVEKKGVLQIPQFQVGGIASSLVRNLVAFEQSNFGTTHHMTAYVMLMRSLISSKEDVELLSRSEILKLEPGTKEKELIYFRNICAEIGPKDYYFDKLCRRVKKYQTSHWNLHRRKESMKVWCHKNITTLKQKYFPDPFKTMSVIIASVLVLLTILQTYYTIRPYYR